MTTRNSVPPPTTVARPPFAYFGGKTRLAGTIAALLPDHEHYIEPGREPGMVDGWPFGG